jgi:hypothetical protein
LARCPDVVRALAEAREEVSARARLTAEKVIVELLDIEREARAAGQFAPAVRAVEVAAKIAGLFVERSVSVSVTDQGQGHLAALQELMRRRRTSAVALPSAAAGSAPPPIHIEPPASALTVTYTETRSASAFDGLEETA